MRDQCGEERVAVWGRGVERDRFVRLTEAPSGAPARAGARTTWCFCFLVGSSSKKSSNASSKSCSACARWRHKVRPLVVGEGPAPASCAGPRDRLHGSSDDEDLAALSPAPTSCFRPAHRGLRQCRVEGHGVGLAVVSADAPSASALVEPNATGMLCHPASADGYVAAIAALIANPERRRAMGARRARSLGALFMGGSVAERQARLSEGDQFSPLNPWATTYHSLESLRLAGGLACFTVGSCA